MSTMLVSRGIIMLLSLLLDSHGGHLNPFERKNLRKSDGWG